MKHRIFQIAVLTALAASSASAEPLADAYSSALGATAASTARAKNSASIRVGRARIVSDPVELFRESFERGRDGVELDEAVSLCRQYRSLYEGRYFFVYCTFHEKNWTEIFDGIATGEDDTRLEYYFERGGGGDYVARLRKAQYQYAYKYEVHFKIYGLKIMGLGKIGPDTPSIEIFSSRAVAPSLPTADYDSEIDAAVACRLALLPGLTNYHRAECVAVRDAKTGHYFYSVRSRNPLLQ